MQSSTTKKRRKKGSARRAAKNKTAKVMPSLNYEETKELVNARLRPHKEISLRQFEELMKDVPLFFTRLTGISAEVAYKNKTVKEKVPIHGNLTFQDKVDDIIRAMSLNPNRIAMTKRFNYTADRLNRQVTPKCLGFPGGVRKLA